MSTSRTLNLILLCLLVIPLTGQDFFRIDSLVTRLNEDLPDSVRCRMMFEVAFEIKAQDTVMAMQYLESAKQISERLNDTRGLGMYHKILGNLHYRHGHFEEAIINYDFALAYFSESEDHVKFYETVKEKGNSYLYMGEYTQAENHYNSAMDFYKRTGMMIGVSRCLNNLGIIHKNRGKYVEALSVYEESILYLDTVKNALDISQAYINMGNLFVYLGSYEKSLEYFNLALVIAEKEKHQKNISLCLSNSGVVQNKFGNYTEAENLYNRSLKVSKSNNDPVMISNCLINLGTNYADMGQPDKGLEYVQQGMAIKMELGEERTISNCYIHLAEIHYMMEQYDLAIDLFNTAIPEKERLGDQEGLVRSYLGLGSVLLDRQQYSEARQITEKALEIAMDINTLEHLSSGFNISREIAVATGDYRSAYNYAMQHFQYSDSLINEATSKAVMEMEFRSRSKVLQNENENLRIQSDLNTLLMRKRNVILYFSLGFTLFLVVSLMLLVYFLRKLRNSSLKLEEQNLVITKQNLKLDHLNKTKDRTMNIIAHDLRGTIGNQLTAIEVLYRIEGDDQVEIDRNKLLGHLKHSASYSLELLENLLHWSRLEEGESYYHPEEINLNTLISNCLALYEESFRNKKLNLIKEIDESLHSKVDRVMMETIYRNLISNAIKFSNPGGTITIKSGKENGNIVFSVCDQGIGMTTEQINTILNNGGFTRRGTANEKGAGMGLTLVREFTNLHNGQLNINSTPDSGSTLEVLIPFIN